MTDRTMSLLHMIEMLLEVIIGDREREACQGLASAPLPCSRDLWEISSTSEWTRRYRVSLQNRKCEQVLTAAKLKSISHISTTDTDKRDGILNDLVAWCLGADQYGTIVCIAVDLSYGQVPIVG